MSTSAKESTSIGENTPNLTLTRCEDKLGRGADQNLDGIFETENTETRTLDLLTNERDKLQSIVCQQNNLISHLKQSKIESLQRNLDFLHSKIVELTQEYNQVAAKLLEIDEERIRSVSIELIEIPRESHSNSGLKIRSSVSPSKQVSGKNSISIIDLNSSGNVLEGLNDGRSEYPYMTILREFALFSSFPSTVLELVSRSAYELRRKEGQVIVSEGEEGAEIFFVASGSVAVLVNNTELTIMSSPTFFGELGILFKFTRTATIVAKTDCLLVVVTKQKLDEILATSNSAVQLIMEEFTASKEVWWKQQQITPLKNFGSEFSNDIARQDLKAMDLFVNAPDIFINRLAMTLECVEFKPGDLIVTINEEADCMYFILSGLVEVVGSTGVVHAEMGSDSFFGEVGILLQMARTASIRAKVESRLFKLKKEHLDEVVNDFPIVKQKLQEAADERFYLFQLRASDVGNPEIGITPDQFDLEVGEQMLSKISFFEGLNGSIIAELAMVMTRRTWSQGEYIIKCGDEGKSMFFLVAGDAEVITEFGDVVDEFHSPDAYFGEVSIIEQSSKILPPLFVRRFTTNLTGPRQLYAKKVSAGILRNDAHQWKTVDLLQDLHDRIASHAPPPKIDVDYKDSDPKEPHKVGVESLDQEVADVLSFKRLSGLFRSSSEKRKIDVSSKQLAGAPTGIYMHGDVGTGKTLTMDLFYQSLPVDRKRRVHFHSFMTDVHKRVHQLRRDRNITYDPIPPLAQELANDAWILCFDELQVTDIADAMILRRLFSELYACGVVTVITSNRPPDELYKNGIQRKSFLPAIELLKTKNLVHALNSGIDYRQQTKMKERVFYYPLNNDTKAAVNNIWQSITSGHLTTPKVIEFLGRSITMPETYDRAAKASFEHLCGNSLNPHSANDFLEIAAHFDTLILTDVPRLTLFQRNEARRFITLIDALYENRVKLYMSSEVDASLLMVGDAEETGAPRELTAADRQLMDDLKLQDHHLTSSIFTGSEEAFAFQRAVSRLVEMQGEHWGRR
ncbi:hypothetical protein HDU84_006317 [Entophlyctis sp. JEL0112]|nr:hypothetical protein HDU84_006317 [Entophlyctis sp. JEL0112]